MCVANSKSRSVELANCWGNIVLNRDMSPKDALMKTGLFLIRSSWPDNLADTFIVGFQHCSEKKVGPSAMAVLNGCGDERGLRFHRSNP